MQIVHEKELELSHHVVNLRATSQPDSDHKSLPGSEENYSPNMTFCDVRSSDSSDPPSTPEQRRKIRRPTPEEDISSLGYTRTKPIPKKDKKVEELKLKHNYEIKSLLPRWTTGRSTTVTNRGRYRTDLEYDYVGGRLPFRGNG